MFVFTLCVSAVATVRFTEGSVIMTVAESDQTVQLCLEILLEGSLGFDLDVPITLHNGNLAGI